MISAWLTGVPSSNAYVRTNALTTAVSNTSAAKPTHPRARLDIGRRLSQKKTTAPIARTASESQAATS
jgi:hypothetical protein